MKILVDMNWVQVLRDAGFDAIHWRDVGQRDAPDSVVLEWAKQRQHVVFTHDLDFGAILAASRAAAPSVIRFRVVEPLPTVTATAVIAAIRRFEGELQEGALISVEPGRARIRMLALGGWAPQAGRRPGEYETVRSRSTSRREQERQMARGGRALSPEDAAPMKVVNVTKLRQDLPGYLAKVRRGERVKITSRGRVVAELVPPAPSREEGAAARARLRGSVVRYNRPLDPVLEPGEWDVSR